MRRRVGPTLLGIDRLLCTFDVSSQTGSEVSSHRELLDLELRAAREPENVGMTVSIVTIAYQRTGLGLRVLPQRFIWRSAGSAGSLPHWRFGF
jgi:hypothetical protein